MEIKEEIVHVFTIVAFPLQIITWICLASYRQEHLGDYYFSNNIFCTYTFFSSGSGSSRFPFAFRPLCLLFESGYAGRENLSEAFLLLSGV